MRAEGSVRVIVAVILLVAVVAVIAWNRQPPTQTVPLASKDKPVDQARKPATDLRDASRERPERERSGRPGQSQK